MPLPFFRKKTQPAQQTAEFSESGILLFANNNPAHNSYLEQLLEIGYAEEKANGILLSWENFYTLNNETEHQNSLPLLALPPFISVISVLVSSGALTDGSFQVNLAGWRNTERMSIREARLRFNAVFEYNQQSFLLEYKTWQVINAVLQFATLPLSERNTETNYRHWGKIRRLAIAADCVMDDFLSKTIVLTPEKLKLDLDKQTEGIIVTPTFDDAPPAWLERFDRLASVPDYYHLIQADGSQLEVALSPPVKQVLQEIKRMPKRTVRGKRAQAFVRNPYAVLGEAAIEVISPESYEQSLEKSGIIFYSFILDAKQDYKGNIQSVSLKLFPTKMTATLQNTRFEFKTADDLLPLLQEIQQQLRDELSCFNWQGYEIELRGDAPQQCQQLQQWYERWLSPIPLLSYEDIFEFSDYSKRVIAIGERQPYYSPFILKDQNNTSWIPNETIIAIGASDENNTEILHSFRNEADVQHLETAIEEAKIQGHTDFNYPPLQKPISIIEAEQICQLARGTINAINKGIPPEKIEKQAKKSTIIYSNIEKIDYIEGKQLWFDKNTAQKLELPSALKAKLKPHQEIGVAWLQHLWRNHPEYYSGCLVADDMGLGKTLQLLTFIHWYLAQENTHPVLIIAPVSLLENWQNELQKFFHTGSIRLLTLYGKVLKEKKIPKTLIDEQLLNTGLNNFLYDDWLGNANLVLTTYETMRDLSISMGKQTWGIMVCDEAQKIKTPGTLVTDAAKSQKAKFKIACTGTPVENSLVDLWCLFDFVQPSLLGSLNSFGSKYRRPIDAEQLGEQIALKELQTLIEPQLLRRIKSEVARDLPVKYDDGYETIRHKNRIQLNEQQKIFYNESINQFKKQQEKGNSILQLLHRLRVICADPRHVGLQTDLSRSLDDYRKLSPKFNWLIERLDEIYKCNEKVLIFTEYLELQRTIQHYLKQRYKFAVKQPYIINGSVKSNSSAIESRQKFINEFQSSSGFNVLILSPIAAGFGLNIQAANHVIHYTRTWNPAKEDQATDRAYRIGQTKDVYVYYPTIYSNEFLTFEAKLDDLLREKRKLATNMLNGTCELKPQEFAELITGDKDVQKNPDYIKSEHLPNFVGRDFEALCFKLWTLRGYHCIQTPISGDGGIDIVAIKGSVGQLIQCKASTTNHSLGWDAVKEVAAGARAYEKQFPNVTFEKVAVTNQRFNNTAIGQAKLHDVLLIEGIELSLWLENYSVLLSSL